jgi:hypothetical protein
VATKIRVVAVEYWYPSAMSSIPFGAVPFRTMWAPPGALSSPVQYNTLGICLSNFSVKRLPGISFSKCC